MKSTLFAITLLVLAHRQANAVPEICGNDVDDDGNGMVDEGCAPSLTTGVCESPLSCGDTGMISWSSGALHYDLPPDVTPRVPFGPGIGMRRFFTSMYSPGTGPTSVNHTPLGARWQHTYMSWIDHFQSGGSWRVVLHTGEGRDVYGTLASTISNWETYTPQAGYHVMSIKRHTVSPNQYQVQLLTGETLYFNSNGQLTQIWDSISPTPNKVLITWTSTSNGNVSTVTDADGKRRLKFNYTSNLLTSMNYQLLISGTWTTQQTTTYAFTSGTLMSVTIGSVLTQQYTYSSNYLSIVKDGAGNQIATFKYDATTAGKVDRVDTPKGSVGLEYASTRTGCTSDTILYFNQANATTCNIDSDCGAGNLCGGKTGTGSTGTCYAAGRCLATSAVNGETVVTSVSPLGSGGSCQGACTEVAQYVWSAGAGLLNTIGTGDPLGNYTSAVYNSNGLPTQITYGDNDSDATTIPTGARTTYLTYDTTYPGRISEVRRKSDLDPNASSCSASVTTGCARTLYTFASDTTLYQLQEIGTTLNSSGATAGYTNTTTYTHDTKGRLTEMDGPVTGMKTTFGYFSSTDPKLDAFLQTQSVYTTATNHLDTTILAYDYWGNVTGKRTADGTVSCRTFEASRNYLTQTREAMAGQTDCASSNGADIISSWARDSALRLQQTTRPDGSCVFYAYDTTGRLATIKRRDDCLSASAGDYQSYVYTADNQISEIDTYDATSTLKAKQPYTYWQSRRLKTIVNPVDSTYQTLNYDARGMVNEIDGEASLAKTTLSISADNRITAETRYKTSSTSDTWTLMYDWLGDQSQVTDGESYATQSVRDDLDRYVKLVTVDSSYPTINVFDAAGRLTTKVEALGSESQATNTFTYDYAGRLVNSDYQGTCPTGSTHPPEIQRTYDNTFPSGITCPIGGGCNNNVGRLSYVKVSLMCSSSYTDDGSLDQETFYSYDAAGRLADEYIRDDTGRIANQLFTWTKNSAPSTATTPSSAYVGWIYGSAGNNSDTDLVTSITSTSSGTLVADTIQWFPFGPLQQYSQENSVSGSVLRTIVSRNLAYRITNLVMSRVSDSKQFDGVAITEDSRGRVTLRDYFDNTTGVQDSYFLYDEQDRVLCETTNFVSTCPTSPATTIKNSHSASPPFTSSGNWQQIIRPEGLATPATDTFTNVGHHITQVAHNQSGTSNNTYMQYDAFGNRNYDYNDVQTHADRTYTYDARHNVINVRSQYPVWGPGPNHTWIITGWNYADQISAFDAKGRRAFKSSHDEVTGLTRSWYFYYDALDRLTEIRYTPDTSAPTTYSLYQIYWLGNRPMMWYQTDYPAASVSKRYTFTDESGRTIALWTWPSSGDAARAWGPNPSAWAYDSDLVGAGVFQPLVFAGQYQDWETQTYRNGDGTVQEPSENLNGFRSYDPFIGGYLQIDPVADTTWSSYVYVDSDPVSKSDPSGRATNEGKCDVYYDNDEQYQACLDSDDGTGGGGGGGWGGGGGGGGWNAGQFGDDGIRSDLATECHLAELGVSPNGTQQDFVSAGNCDRPHPTPSMRYCKEYRDHSYRQCQGCEYWNYDWSELWACRTGENPIYKMNKGCEARAWASYRARVVLNCTAVEDGGHCNADSASGCGPHLYSYTSLMITK